MRRPPHIAKLVNKAQRRSLLVMDVGEGGTLSGVITEGPNFLQYQPIEPDDESHDCDFQEIAQVLCDMAVARFGVPAQELGQYTEQHGDYLTIHAPEGWPEATRNRLSGGRTLRP